MVKSFKRLARSFVAEAKASRPEMPSGEELRRSSVSSVPLTAAAVPDGMASAALIGLSPIHGLYAAFIAPIVGGFTASTKRMVIGTTSAASLAAYAAVADVEQQDRLPTLLMVTVLAGAFMLLAGWFGLGRVAYFVSHSVMTGFLTGVAISIVLSQVPDLVGAPVEGDTTFERALNVVLDPGGIDLPTLAVGFGALLLLVIGGRSRYAMWAPLGVLIGLSVLVGAVDGLDSVAIVRDVSAIESGFPSFLFPDLSYLSVDVVVGALSVAVIVLVQGAGVAQAFPNEAESRANPNADFAAQGWANIASALFRGIPVGASIGSTALSVSMGARTRWVAIMSGLWMLAVLVVLSDLAERVAMPTLAAILIAASIASISPANLKLVWRSGWPPRIIAIVTFVSTLALPVGAAIALGVSLSAVVYIGREASGVELVEMYELETRVRTRRPPKKLESDSVIVLAVFGSLFFAAARQIELLLPQVGDAKNPVVVLRLHGQHSLGATATLILSAYAAQLEAAGGELILSEIDEELADQLSPEMFGEGKPIEVVEATSRLDDSTREAALRILAAEPQLSLEPLDDDDAEALVRRAVRRARGDSTR